MNMSITAIARKAGVSHVTVSRVINNQPGVSDATADRIRRIIAETGYSPRPDRRRRKSPYAGNLIAMLVFEGAGPTDAGFVQAMLRGATDACRSEDAALALFWVQSADDVRGVLRRVEPMGLLLAGHGAPAGLEGVIGHLPSVWLTSHKQRNQSFVLAGNEAVGELAADYLIGCGHERLALVAADTGNPSLSERSASFCQATARHGRHPTMFVDNTRTPGREEVERVIREQVGRLRACRRRPTGVFLPTDQMAAIFYRELRRQGMEPGRDVQTISVDNDLAYLTGLHPRPATIDIGSAARGARGVEQLMWQRKNPKHGRSVQIVIEPLLVKGEAP